MVWSFVNPISKLGHSVTKEFDYNSFWYVYACVFSIVAVSERMKQNSMVAYSLKQDVDIVDYE